jgi:putative oxidoreductase
MQSLIERFGPLAGRMLLSAIYIISGINKASGFSGFAGTVDSLGVPLPTIAAGIVVVVEIFGGLALLLGYYARHAAAALAVFVLIATALVHLTELTALLKNLSLIGGLVYVIVYGVGAYSINDRSLSPTRTRADTSQSQ